MRWSSRLTIVVTIGALTAALAVPAVPAVAATTAGATSASAGSGSGSGSGATSTAAIVPTRRPYPAGGNTVIGAGVDGGNQNAQFADTVPATVAPVWRNAPARCPQAAGTAAVSISLSRTLTVVVESQYQCASVSAYALKTGELVWRKQYHFATSASIAYGNVYVFHDDPTTSGYAVDALALATGRTVWSNEVDGLGGRAVSIASGLVATDDGVLSATTGKFLFDARSDVGSPGMSIIAGGRVFYSSGGGTTATDTKGRWLWRTTYPASVQGAWPSTTSALPSVHDGLLYVPGSKTIVIDTTTGRIVRYLPASFRSIAFDGRTGFFTEEGSNTSLDVAAATPASVRAVDLVTGAVRWTHLLPMKGWSPWNPDTAPLVSNGIVWTTATSDTGDPTSVVALDEVTGAQLSEFEALCDDGGGGGNIAIAQHRLFVSTGCGVQAYVPSKTVPTAADPGEVFTDGGFEHGTDGWVAMGNASVARTTGLTRSGSGALTVTAASSDAGTIGATRTISTGSAPATSFTSSCWVRPSTSGVSVAYRLREWSPSDPPSTPTTPIAPHSGWGPWDVQRLTPGVWTRLDQTGAVQANGDSFAMQVFSVNAAALGSTLTVDDCTLAPPSS